VQVATTRRLNDNDIHKAVLSFKRGANNEIVSWLASEVGTLKLTATTRFTSMTKVK
jgi:hypothetical protein